MFEVVYWNSDRCMRRREKIIEHLALYVTFIQRLQALQDFKTSQVDYLLATDVASRGLDIKGVETVINYDMPGQLSAYTHRVGRTARAGRKGRAITLVGEADRKMLKAAIKQSKSDMVRHRVIPSEAINKYAETLEEMRGEVQAVLREEKEEKALRQADMEVRKGQNLIEHEAEIFSRPARTWFQSEKEKQTAKGEFLSSSIARRQGRFVFEMSKQ